MTWQQWRRAKAEQYFIDKYSQPEGWWMKDSPVMEFYVHAQTERWSEGAE